jgi:hypothetical protein
VLPRLLDIEHRVAGRRLRDVGISDDHRVDALFALSHFLCRAGRFGRRQGARIDDRRGDRHCGGRGHHVCSEYAAAATADAAALARISDTS